MQAGRLHHNRIENMQIQLETNQWPRKHSRDARCSPASSKERRSPQNSRSTRPAPTSRTFSAARQTVLPAQIRSTRSSTEKELAGAILCFPTTVGSTMGGASLMGVGYLGQGPKAMLYAEHADSVSLAGLLMDDIWNDRRVVTIDLLGDEFLDDRQDGRFRSPSTRTGPSRSAEKRPSEQTCPRRFQGNHRAVQAP